MASTPSTKKMLSAAIVTSKNSRPRTNGSVIGWTSQAANCIAPPISTGYSTGWSAYGTLPADSPSLKYSG